MGALIGELVIKPAIKATVMFMVMEGLRRLVRRKKDPTASIQETA